MLATSSVLKSARALGRLNGLCVARPVAVNTQPVRYVMQKKLKHIGSGSGKKGDGKAFVPRHIAAKQKGGQVVFNKEELLAREAVSLDRIDVLEQVPVLHFHDILAHLRDTNMAAMANNEDGLLEMEIEMDFRTDRVTKFKSNFAKTVMLPHLFEDDKQNSILVFCETDEQRKIAFDAGASIAGDEEIVKAVEKGEISSYEFTHAISTPAMIPVVQKIRKILKDKFPTTRDGTLGEDIQDMVTHFKLGKTFHTATEMGPELGTTVLKIGRLHMPEEELRANMVTYLNFLKPLSGYRSKDYGPFIQQATLSVQGGKEKFYLHLPTAHLDQQGIADYFAGELQEAKVEEQEEIEEEEEEKIPYFVNDNEREEWLAYQRQKERERRIAEERRIIMMTEKQLKAHRVAKYQEAQAQEKTRLEQEEKIKEAYRLRRLERLSAKLQRDIDLDSKFRKPLYI